MTSDCKGLSGSTRISSIPWDSSWPESVGESERAVLLGYLEGRFGIAPAVFDEFVFFKRKKTWWMVRNSPHIQGAALLKVSAVGLKAFTKVAKFIKPTTEMIQVFGNRATRAVFAIHEKDLDKLFLGENLSVETTLEDGYVILNHEGDFLGLGLLVNGRIRSQLPRHYAEKLMKQRTQNPAGFTPS